MLDELKDELSRIKEIVEGLRDYKPFQMLVEEIQKLADSADCEWHTLSMQDRERFEELKLQKRTALTIINSLDALQARQEEIQNELNAQEQPDKYQASYYDQE